jgi:hypothetical protein
MSISTGHGNVEVIFYERGRLLVRSINRAGIAISPHPPNPITVNISTVHMQHLFIKEKHHHSTTPAISIEVEDGHPRNATRWDVYQVCGCMYMEVK